MRVWVICFFLLFGVAELLQWMREFSLPLPIFILGGVALAFLSNYTKLTNLPFHPDYEEPELPQSEKPPTIAARAAPPVTVTTGTRRSISFTIRKPFEPGE